MDNQRRQQLEAWNADYEAEKRAFKNQQEMHDNQTIHGVRQQLANTWVWPLPETPDVRAVMPVNRLPTKALELVQACATSIGTHPEVLVICLFAAMFTAARGSFRIQISEHHIETLTGYFIVSAPSGHKKSAAMETFRRVFVDIENERQARYCGEGRLDEGKILKAAIKKAESGLAQKLLQMTQKLGSPEAARASMTEELRAHQQLLRKFKKGSSLPRILADVTTLEALPFEMEAQGEALAIMEAEGSAWKRLKSTPNDIVLKAFAGEPSASDTKTLGSVSLKAPVLSICILAQPVVLKDVYDDTRSVERGLVPRILPYIAPGRILIDNPSGMPIQASLLDWYDAHIRALLAIQRPVGEEGERTFHTLTLAPDAKTEFEAYSHFCRGLEKNVNGVEAGGYRSFLNKLPGHAVRLAGAIHLMKCPDPQKRQIDRDSVAVGAAFADFFREHAAVAFDPTARDGITIANKVLKWLHKHPCSNFSVRDAHRGVGSNNHKSDQVEAGLEVMQANGYIRGIIMSSGQLRYVVNPKVM